MCTRLPLPSPYRISLGFTITFDGPYSVRSLVEGGRGGGGGGGGGVYLILWGVMLPCNAVRIGGVQACEQCSPRSTTTPLNEILYTFVYMVITPLGMVTSLDQSLLVSGNDSIELS